MTLARLMAGVALLALMGQPALAQSQDKTQPPKQEQTSTGGAEQKLAQEDMEFAKKAAGDGMAEVKLGELAQKQADNDQVKQFGQRMVDDHGKANDQLKSIAEKKGVELPQDLPAEAQKAYDELKSKSGQEFDQAYTDMMVEDHHKAIDLFQQEAKSGKDADLQKFAEETLPTLQEHLDLAEKAKEQVTASDQGGMKQEQASEQSKQDMGAGATPPEGLKKTNEPMQTQKAGAASSSEQAATEPSKEQQPAMAKKPEAAGATGQAAAPTGSQPQATTGEQQQAAAEPTKTEPKEAAQPSAGQLSAQDVIGTEVVNTKGDQVGEIKDLVIDQNQIEYAVISVGGFLGIGAKQVAIPLDQLKLGKDQTYLMTAETEAQLEKMPEYKEDQYQSKG